ncbi:hypothetical protein EON81_06900 [bacterium]|nr:MAG: hypothetical protein EON81_06900 [bacterium]
MAKFTEIIRFSDHFKIDPTPLSDAGAIDPIVNFDSRYFIDPLLLGESDVPEVSGRGSELLSSLFSRLYTLLEASNGRDVAWRGARALLNGKEVRSIGLGYGSSSSRGSSLSEEIATRMIDTGQQIIRLGIKDKDLFYILPLIEEGIGPDAISDITAAAILPALAEYTERVLSSFPDLPRKSFNVGTPAQVYSLPEHPYHGGPMILVPQDIVRELPIVSSWSEVGDACQVSRELRERFNTMVACCLAESDTESKKNTKAAAKEAVLNSSNAAQMLVDLIEDLKANIASVLNNVPDHLLASRLKSDPALQQTQTSNWKAPTDADSALALVRQIISDYKFLIEDRRLSLLLYKEDGRPRHEHFAQMLFFAVAYARCQTYDLDVTPEADTGNGPVDFKFSKGFHARILVEIKLSTNSQAVHGVKTQLPKYSAAEETALGIFLFVDVGKAGKKWKNIAELVNLHQPAGVVEAQYVDAIPKASASNL